jgi:hypothetical protein
MARNVVLTVVLAKVGVQRRLTVLSTASLLFACASKGLSHVCISLSLSLGVTR